MNDNFVLDEVDRAIVQQLRDNGRATNQQIAETLGLTAATVSSRIRRMEDANKLRVVAVSDFAAHGYNMLMQVAIELAELPEIFAAHLVTGRHDIDILIALHNSDELPDFLQNKLAPIKGIRTIVPSIVTDVLKYRFDVAPIEAREGE